MVPIILRRKDEAAIGDAILPKDLHPICDSLPAHRVRPENSATIPERIWMLSPKATMTLRS